MKAERITKELELELKYMHVRVEGVRTKQTYQYYAVFSICCGETHFTQTEQTREGWPLLTVKTEVNGDSESTN